MTSEQRRKFSRVQFHEAARLQVSERRLMCRVRDLSLKGALLDCPGALGVGIGEPCALTLTLAPDDEDVLAMKGEIAHLHVLDDTVQVGMVCREIDLESITHLRRLIALNLGDEALLARELAALLRE